MLPARITVAQICPAGANPCVVNADTNIAGGTVIDIGARDFVVAAGKTLNVQSAGRCSNSATTPCMVNTDCPAAQFCRPTTLTIIANNVTLQGGAKILSGALSGNAQSVIVQAAGAFTMGPNSRIESVTGSAGSIDVTAASVSMNGFLRAQAGDRDGDGGDVSVVSGGNVAIGGLGIEASAGDRFGCPFGVQLIGADITVSAPVAPRSGDCDGGDIDLSAVGSGGPARG